MNTAAAERTAHPLVVLKDQLEHREHEFKAALPKHIPVERFMRVLMTAVQNNPKLMQVERRSLFTASIKAAQDGLLPDGREGAIVEYKDRDRGPIAQWMPMIAGLRKKVRNSGEIATWDAHVVYEKDEFDYAQGDEPFIRHRPTMDSDPGPVIAAYSVAILKSGEKSREVMTRAQIEKVRSKSRTKDKGPWVEWYEEMCRKTVARRHSKVLPMSTDLDDLIRRDDDLYEFDRAKEEARDEAQRPKMHALLDQVGKRPSDPAEPQADVAEAPQAAAPAPADDDTFPGDLPFAADGHASAQTENGGR
jgi:recombination protein RecT